LTDEVIGNIMVQNNVADLKARVDQLVASGTLVATLEPVDEKNFVVGQEVDDTGKVLNPRLQFVLGALNEDLRNKIKGAKVGDSVVFQEGKLKFDLQEAYAVVTPAPAVEAEAATEAVADTQAVASAPAEAAVEQSSTDANEATAQPSQSSGS